MRQKENMDFLSKDKPGLESWPLSFPALRTEGANPCLPLLRDSQAVDPLAWVKEKLK